MRPATAVRWARCAECGTVRKLRKDGRIPKHLVPLAQRDPVQAVRVRDCKGSGQPPESGGATWRMFK